MAKFKIGDKVIRTADLYKFPLGNTVCTVTKVRPMTGSIELNEIPTGFAYDDRYFELVTNPKFKVGDVVTRKDKNTFYSDKTITDINDHGYITKMHDRCLAYSYSYDYLEDLYELIEPVISKEDKPTDLGAKDDSLLASQTQVGGDHYTKMKLQPLEACYQRYGYFGLKASIHTKVDKYFRSKDNEIEDLKKAIHCIQLLLEKAELEAKK